jgi:hypothetical protein
MLARAHAGIDHAGIDHNGIDHNGIDHNGHRFIAQALCENRSEST